MAPTCRVTSRPSLNNAIVGIALMRKRRARFCASSVLTFATTHLPAPSCATLFSSGATILHGPHHGAQKSTNTGRAERAVKASNARSFATSIGSPGSAQLVVFQTIALTTPRAGHQYTAVIHLCRVHLKPYRYKLRRLVAICMGKDSAANIERRTPNIEFHTEPSALG